MYKNQQYDNNVIINQSVNFKFIQRGEVKDTSTLDGANTYLDERMYLLSVDTDFNNMQWYFNYIESAAYFARRNREAYPTYLLDLGYVPIVYVPTCVPTLSVKMTPVLDEIGVDYIKVKGTSFVRKYFNTDVVDAWVHKTDAAKYLNCKPEQVRSIDFIKEVYNFGTSNS